MTISIALALVALVIAILGVSDLKTIRSAEANATASPWWRRLTLAGYAKILFALLTFCLIGLKEHQARDQRAAASARESLLADDVSAANAKLEAQSAELQQARDLLQALTYESAEHRNAFGIYDRAMRGIHVFLADHRVLLDGRISYEIDYEPVASDKITWRLSCPGAGLPPRDDACSSSEGYGRLVAQGEAIPLVETAGEAIFSGSAQNGGYLSLELPHHNCSPFRRELIARQCQFDLSVYRTNEKRQLDLLRETGGKIWDQRLIGRDSELCRSYELLHGETCEALFQREPR